MFSIDRLGLFMGIKAFDLKTILQKILFVSLSSICFAFFSPSSTLGATITSNGSGNWNAGATWAGGIAPVATDDVVIRPGDVITVTANATANSLTFASTAATNGTVTVNIGIVLTITANVIFQNSATLNTAATLTGAGTINVGGSVTIGNTSVPTASHTATVTWSAAILNVTGGITLTSQRSGITNNNPTLQIASGVVSVGGTLSCVTASNAASTTLVTLQTGAQSGTLNLSGAPAITTSGNAGISTFSFNGTTSTVNYNGASAQTVRNVTYRTLKINNAVGAT